MGEASKVVLKGGERKKKEKESVKNEDVGEEKGKTLMELLELEMRARAIKALLMKAGKDEGEAESLAIEKALDEQKQKKNDAKDLHAEEKDKEVIEELEDHQDDEEEEPDRVFSKENTAMSKAKNALALADRRKELEDEIQIRKEEEAKFLYEEELRKEEAEKEQAERQRLLDEMKMMKQKIIEKEQEERRMIIEQERDKMRKDHDRKEAMKQQRSKENLLDKIKQMKDQEEEEKEILEEHYKTKM